MAIKQGWGIQMNPPWAYVTYLHYETFRTRREAIAWFMNKTEHTWKWWYRRGCRAVPVLITDELWRVNEGKQYIVKASSIGPICPGELLVYDDNGEEANDE